jgi:hypothetical protein
MSLLQIRRERKAESIGPFRPPRLAKLIAGLILVVLAFWYLSGLG